MSKLLLRGGRLLDPASGRDERGDLLLEDGLVKAAGAGIAARMLAVATLASSPPALAPRFENPKKRPRSVTGTTRPIRSIHAGMSAPPTPVTISSITSSTPSVVAGARSARKNAASASTRNGTRSQIV